ncbi:hypothetical protein CK203_018335 [Vitis vinifera]|uniref:Uncharacterized protein n=1 Tax=Vitis vinifera TaxID=29760 RepID=A0A438JPL9_VITVI|nr:hypothetical protein CK203_018335 [Vitis vinifera]
MESMIGYRFGTLPHQSIHMSSGYKAAITTKPYCFSHFSTKPHLSFSHSSRSRPLEHILGPITFRVGHPSTSLTDQKSRPPQAFTAEHSEEVVEVAKELKESGHQDIALQLLKIHDRQLDIERDAVGYYTIKMEIMQILIDKKMRNEASEYSRDIEEKRSNHKHYFNFEPFDKLKVRYNSVSPLKIL